MSNYIKLNRRLDLAGVLERVEKREQIEKQEQEQTQQQVDVVEAYRRGMRSFLSEAERKVRIERLKGDPAMAFFLLANRDPSSA
jgi:hypothetical protein